MYTLRPLSVPYRLGKRCDETQNWKARSTIFPYDISLQKRLKEKAPPMPESPIIKAFLIRRPIISAFRGRETACKLDTVIDGQDAILNCDL